MTSRAPIHLGSGEPVLLLHPFLISQLVWQKVAPQLADTGRYEVVAPTMAGHNGGPPAGTWFLSSAVLADHVERRLDQLGWDTCHVVGNSLGGWVAFELERRGRARTVTGIAPAGGWTRWAPTKFEVIAKFVSGMPFWALARWAGLAVVLVAGVAGGGGGGGCAGWGCGERGEAGGGDEEVLDALAGDLAGVIAGEGV